MESSGCGCRKGGGRGIKKDRMIDVENNRKVTEKHAIPPLFS